MNIFGVIFEKLENIVFSLCELPLILRVALKRKKRARDICKGILYRPIAFEQDWPVGLDATLGDGQKIENYFSSLRDFSGKSR